MKEKELLQLKEDIDTAKETIATLNGQLQYQLKELKDTWAVSIKKAPAKLIEMEEEITELEAKIEQQTEALEKQLE